MFREILRGNPETTDVTSFLSVVSLRSLPWFYSSYLYFPERFPLNNDLLASGHDNTYTVS